MLELRIGQSVRAGDVDELPRAPPDAPCGKSASGAGAGADRHPVRSGQRADGRNRNENPVAGVAPRRGGWLVGVDHPQEHFLAGCLRLVDAAVATTSRMKRTWGPPGQQRHHLIDPITGLPALTAVQSVTVVTAEGWYAEALTKAAFLAGPDAGAQLLDDAGASGFFFCDGDDMRAVGRWAELLA